MKNTIWTFSFIGLLQGFGIFAWSESEMKPQYVAASTGLTEGPKFDQDMDLPQNISVQRDVTVFLQCKIIGLRDQSVSWYRRKGSEIHIITVDFQTYHNDERFSVAFEQPNNWRLRIQYVQEFDEGSYECQVSSHPPIASTINLLVVVPVIEILDDREVQLQEKFYKPGSTIHLQCKITNFPTVTSLQMLWFHGKQRINYDDSRGGVSVKTEVRGTVAKSWLRISAATIEDSGVYYCNVSGLTSTSVKIHIVKDEHPAAIQGSQCNQNADRNLLISLFALSFFVNKYIGLCFS